MIKLISYEISGPGEVEVTITDGLNTETVKGKEIDGGDYFTERILFAFGKWYILRSELEYHPVYGTCSAAKLLPLT